uniref:Uncharacterized protein n=1 Tax=Triticum urartu TaxID=4572 RepID=A0A8R7UR53_TRIUA
PPCLDSVAHVVPVLPNDSCCPVPAPRYTETDVAATSNDYGVDDPSLLPEQPDVGAQDPDATVDDDSYYTGGAYYYVLPADDDQE